MVSNGQNVKSEDIRLTDGHERGRNFLSDSEMEGLLEARKKGVATACGNCVTACVSAKSSTCVART